MDSPREHSSEDDRRKALVDLCDIDRVVGDYGPLKDMGDGTLRALCPFHDDRHLPGCLTVDPRARTFRCAACRASGDVVTFVGLWERVPEHEAMSMLEARI